MRAVSRWEVVSISLNQIVGSGVFLLPAAAAAVLGAASTIAVVVAGLAIGLIALCFAEAASHFEEPGGPYLYAREAFGPFAACQVGWTSWLSRVASSASIANGMALAASFLWPGAAAGWGRLAVVLLPLAFLTWINVVGVKAGARATVVLLIGKSVPLLFFVLVGIWFVHWGDVVAIKAPSSTGLGRTALLLLFAYAGFENVPAAAGEYRNPRRDIPFALIASIGIITTLYLLVQIVSVGTLPNLAESASPLAEAARGFAGPAAALLLTVGALVSMLGTNASSTLAGPRFALALAADGYGPAAMARIHPRYRTPAVAIVVQGVAAGALAATGSFVTLALVSVIARLFAYVTTAAAVPVLRRRFGDHPAALRLPGGMLVPGAALVVSLALVASSDPASLLAGAVALLVGAALYVFRRDPVVEIEPAA